MTARKNNETSQSVAESTPTRISELTKRLQELKREVQSQPNNPQKLEEIRKTREELLSLQREFQRAKQFTRLSKEQIPE